MLVPNTRFSTETQNKKRIQIKNFFYKDYKTSIKMLLATVATTRIQYRSFFQHHDYPGNDHNILNMHVNVHCNGINYRNEKVLAMHNIIARY